jgi:hypothetical protein
MSPSEEDEEFWGSLRRAPSETAAAEELTSDQIPEAVDAASTEVEETAVTGPDPSEDDEGQEAEQALVPREDQLEEGDEVVPAGQAAVIKVDHGCRPSDRVRARLPVGAPAAGIGASEPLAEVRRRRFPVRLAPAAEPQQPRWHRKGVRRVVHAEGGVPVASAARSIGSGGCRRLTINGDVHTREIREGSIFVNVVG